MTLITTKETKPVLLMFHRNGKTAYFDYKDGAWRFWGDAPVEECAKALWDYVGQFAEVRMQQLIKEREGK